MKKLLVGVSAVAMIGFAGSAMAQTTGSANIGVTIDVLESVSIWANAAALTLTIDPASDPSHTNSGAVDTILNYVTNVQADISVEVTGDLPEPIVDTFGGPPPPTDVEIQFFVYNDTAANALNDMRDVNGATNYKGVWTDATLDAASVPVSFAADLSAANGGAQTPVAFAAYSPQGLPDVGQSNLTATFTITESNGAGPGV
jgi:hypothetical protein